jgi:hypothetical protein
MGIANTGPGQWPMEGLEGAGIGGRAPAASMPTSPANQTWDAMETYFECITTCSLEDGECITRCVEILRESG